MSLNTNGAIPRLASLWMVALAMFFESCAPSQPHEGSAMLRADLCPTSAAGQAASGLHKASLLEVLMMDRACLRIPTERVGIMIGSNFADSPLFADIVAVFVGYIEVTCSEEKCLLSSNDVVNICRALDSFFPLVALVRLTFSVGRRSTSFGRNSFF